MTPRRSWLTVGPIVAMASMCSPSEKLSSPDDGAPSTVDGTNDDGPLAGGLYARARDFVRRYCAGCHWKNGKDPKQAVAYPAFHVDSYEDWANSRTILLAVLDKWNPDGDVMPPPDAVEPSDEERRAILDWIVRNSPNTVDGK